MSGCYRTYKSRDKAMFVTWLIGADVIITCMMSSVDARINCQSLTQKTVLGSSRWGNKYA